MGRSAAATLAWRLALGLAVVAGLGGCATTASSSSVTVTGKTLTIYANAASSTDPAQAADVFDAEQLALHQAGSTVDGASIRLVKLTDPKPSDDARTAIQDTTTIAYLGDIDPGASADSIPITNDQDILQVSPTDNALQYTQASPAVAGSPKNYYAEEFSAYGYTFARVVGSSALEAQAVVKELTALRVRKLYVADDGSEYGAALAYALRSDAARVATVAQGPPSAASVKASGADAMFYAAASPASAVALFDAAGAQVPSLRMLGPSALYTPSFASGLDAGVQSRVYVSAPGFLPADLNSAGRRFVSAFTSSYGHAPALRAIFGYEAMSAVLAVLGESRSPGDRTTVVHNFLAIKDRSSALGTYSLQNGDPTVGSFVIARVRNGTLAPFRFFSIQG